MAEKFARKIRFYWDPRRPFERLVSLLSLIRRDQLEVYEDNLLWEIIRGKAIYHVDNNIAFVGICFPTSYLNKGIESLVHSVGWVVGRSQGGGNYYFARMNEPASTADFVIGKIVSDVYTALASEALDIAANTFWRVKLEVKDSILKGYREDMVTPKITVTDTAFTTEGKWGSGDLGAYGYRFSTLINAATCKLVEAASSSSLPNPIAFYKLPVTGMGSFEDPYRAQMPELIEGHPEFGKINKYALTYAAFIPTNPETGKPKHDFCVVKIYEHRADYLAPLDDALSQVEAKSLPTSNPKLSKEEVISLLLEMDPKLTEEAAKEFVET